MTKYLPVVLSFFVIKIFAYDLDSLANLKTGFNIDTLSTNVISDSLHQIDSTGILKKKIEADTLYPIQEIPLENTSSIIRRETFLFTNYRYTGDFLRSFPLNFIRDFAFVGQPNETFIYGSGNGGISFLQDGVLWNDRYTNSLNLNYLQSEDIDSIEIVPSPRGFLFGLYNNPVTVNFITRGFVSPEPYTRLRYYEGPDGEAMIDGKFNALIYKRLNLSFQLTNRSKDDRYTNSDYSMWQTNIKLKYFLSNAVNLSLIYNSVDSEIGLNGGVKVQSISGSSSDINTVLYDSQLAPVFYPNRIGSVLNHNFRLITQTLPFSGARLDLSFYYRYSDNQIKNDLDTVLIKDIFENKTSGLSLRFSHKIGIISWQILGNYEKNNFEATYEEESKNTYTSNFNYLSVAGLFSLDLFEKKLVPSFYCKYFKRDFAEHNKSYANSNAGYGFDIFYKPWNEFSVYAGYSKYDQFKREGVQSIETGVRYIKQNILFDLKFFTRKNFIPYSVANPYWTGIEIELPESSIKGVGLRANYSFWKILIETNSSYYFDMVNYSYSLPDKQFIGGIYLKDKFFNENLNLKAGVIFYYTRRIAAENGIIVAPSKKVDISVAGEIKKVAIVYFIWENITDNQYFITPYYPMPARNIRFGLSWELFD
jgi:TonB-dependent Receptor Plug Domain